MRVPEKQELPHDITDRPTARYWCKPEEPSRRREITRREKKCCEVSWITDTHEAGV